MSDEVLSAISVIVTQVLAVVVLLLKGRRTAAKVEEVEALVKGQCQSLEALLAAQRVSRVNSKTVTDETMNGE